MMHSRVVACFIAAAVLSGFVACSSPNTEYVGAKSLEPIALPDNIDGEGLGELFPVPAGKAERVQTDIPLPPTVGSQLATDATRFVLGERYWVLNNKTPSTTWSQLLEFWQSEQIAVTDQAVSDATMRTEWFTEAIQPGFEVRYQLELVRGLQFNSTEIHLINQVRPKGTNAGDWGEVSDNPNHNQWLVDRLTPFLNNRPDALNDSFLASTLNLPARVTYRETANEPILLLDIDDERTASTLVSALEQEPLYLYSADQSRNIYHINVIDPNQNTGLLSRLNPFSSSEPLESPYSLSTLLASIDPTAEAARIFVGVGVGAGAGSEQTQSLNDVPGYLIAVTELNSAKQLLIRNGNGEYLPLDEARYVIDIIRRQLR